MVEHHIKNNLYAVVVQIPDQLLQLGSLTVILGGRRIAAVRRKKAARIVAPIIQQALAVHLSCRHRLVKLKDRHQLHRIDPKLLQIRDLLTQSCKSTLMLDA